MGKPEYCHREHGGDGDLLPVSTHLIGEPLDETVSGETEAALSFFGRRCAIRFEGEPQRTLRLDEPETARLIRLLGERGGGEDDVFVLRDFTHRGEDDLVITWVQAAQLEADYKARELFISGDHRADDDIFVMPVQPATSCCNWGEASSNEYDHTLHAFRFTATALSEKLVEVDLDVGHLFPVLNFCVNHSRLADMARGLLRILGGHEAKGYLLNGCQLGPSLFRLVTESGLRFHARGDALNSLSFWLLRQAAR